MHAAGATPARRPATAGDQAADERAAGDADRRRRRWRAARARRRPTRPALRPSTSGLPSGLRVRPWKIAPETPKATPTNRPVSARGTRSSWIDEASTTRRRWPTRVASTSRSGSVPPPTVISSSTAPTRQRREHQLGGEHPARDAAPRTPGRAVRSDPVVGRQVGDAHSRGDPASADQGDEQRRAGEGA